ncbi:MAG: hypothetical protein ACW9W4_10020 [Candidatus Nitrosopumilus sp. bin_7KS]
MKSRLLIIIGIILVSVVLMSSVYAMSIQNRCESILGETHYPRPLTFWNCLDYLNMVDHPPPKFSSVMPDSDVSIEPEPEPDPIPDSESLQRQKQKQAKIQTQKEIMMDYQGNQHQ